MATQFMTGTPKEELEKLMQVVPGFRARKNGVVVSRLQSGKKCEKVCQRNIPLSKLIGLFGSEVDEEPLTARMMLMAGKEPVFFLTGHRERFKRFWDFHGMADDLSAMCAAAYLLSADRILFERSVSAVKPDLILFRQIRIQGIDLRGYILFHSAKGLYQGTKHLSLSELTDPELIDDEVFYLIIAGFLIRRYGEDVLNLEDIEGSGLRIDESSRVRR